VRRSSRVILLLGILLAVGAFVLILFLNAGGQAELKPTPAIAQIVVAAVDIPQGTAITDSMLTTKDVPLAEAPVDAFALKETVIGKTARQSVAAGAYVPQTAIAGPAGAPTVNVAKELKPGERAIPLSVTELSGVGTLIQAGDRVDAIFAFTGEEIPIIFTDIPSAFRTVCGSAIVCDTGIKSNGTSVKLVLQNLRVVGTLLPPAVAAPTSGAEATPTSGEAALTGRTEIVILPVTADQAEALRFGQFNAAATTLVLRSPADAQASPDVTEGVNLKTMIEKYGVLPPAPIAVPFPTDLRP
jgi:Flp pilus assembly protein CpaB